MNIFPSMLEAIEARTDSSDTDRLALIAEVRRLGACLGEMLAILHCDGGHYQDKRGAAKASSDAITMVHNLRTECDRLTTELAESKRALKPFADIATAYARKDAERARHYRDEGCSPGPDLADSHRVSIGLGECRRALSALKQ